MKTRLVFVRHAEAEGNFKRIFHGWTDGEITEKGHHQARLVGERMGVVPLDVIYSSTLRRTLQTAGYIDCFKNLGILPSEGLKEINGGDWEGRRWDELPVLWPQANHTWENEPHLHQMPNGESMADFQKRLIDEVEFIAGRHPGKNICIVTHGTAIRTLMCHFYGFGLEEMINIAWYDNTSVTIVDLEDKQYEVVLEGDVSHLPRELKTIENQDWWDEYAKKLNERRQGK